MELIWSFSENVLIMWIMIITNDIPHNAIFELYFTEYNWKFKAPNANTVLRLLVRMLVAN